MATVVALDDRTRRAPTGVRLLVEFAQERGVASETTLAGTGLTLLDLADAETVVDLAQEVGAVGNVLRALGDAPGLGALLGSRFSIAAHGDLGFALLTCSSAREAADLCLRFARTSLVLDDVASRPEGGALVVELLSGALPSAVAPFAAERDIVAFGGLVTFVLPDARLEFTIDLAPERVRAISAALPAHRVERGGRTCVRLSADVLSRPLPNADPVMAREFTRRLEDRVRRGTGTTLLSGRVRGELLNALPSRLNAPQIADRLHVAPRTLRRRLEQEGTTFQGLADETLADLATDLLRGGLPVAVVASRLGYADSAAFTRAFRRWTGEAPGRWARRQD